MKPLVDLFPSTESGAYNYREAKAHSQRVDEFLGFQIDAIEAKLIAETQDAFEIKEKWVGLDPSALQTPYGEIRNLLHAVQIKPKQTIIDFGAAYGRMGLVVGAHYPESQFIGYEISKERVEEGNRIYRECQLKNAKLLQQDLADPQFQFDEADVYFIYDFGTLRSIQKIIAQLKTIVSRRPITVVGRGRRVRDEIERKEFWLSQVIAPEHYGNFSIYRSA